MKIEREKLLNGMGAISTVVADKSPIVGLDNVILNCEHNFADDQMVLAGSNITESVITRIPVDGTMKGVCVNALRFYRLIQALSGNDVELAVKGKRLVVNDKASLVTTSVEGYPYSLPTVDTKDYPLLAHVDAETFYDAINQASFALLRDVDKKLVNWQSVVEITLDKKEMTVKAANGNVLAISKTECDSDDTQVLAFPKEVAWHIKGKMMNAPKLDIMSNKSRTVICSQGMEYIVQQANVEYPDISPILNQKFDRVITCDSGELSEALNLVKAVATGAEIKTVVLDCKKKGITVKGDFKDVGTIEESIGGEATEPCEIKLSLDYLSDLLRYSDGEISLSLSEHNMVHTSFTGKHVTTECYIAGRNF